ncbi:TPA: ABC transporter ATP-binding protein [Bacillus anthracis]|nr:ABC transporter ATP-binding protein [Bacillus anthracis]
MKIEFQNVSTKFGDFEVFNDLNFDINSNCITAIVGKNGAGKTTLIKGLSTLLVFDEGQINFFDKNITKDNYSFFRGQISISLGDSKNLYLNLTVIENIKYFLSIHKNDYNSKKELIDYYLSIFNLNSYKNKIVSKLSKGMKQKLSIIISLVKDSKVLILDEPDIGLDIESMSTLKQILNNEKENKTIIITSHNLNLVKDISDRLILLDDGKVKYSGDINTFINSLNNNATIEIYFEDILSDELKKSIREYSLDIEFKEKSFLVTVKKECINDIFKTLLNFNNKIIDIGTRNSFENIIENVILKREVSV